MIRNTKILLGVLSVIPLITLAIYFIFFIRFFFKIASEAEGPTQFEDPSAFLTVFLPIILVLIIGSLVGLFLFVYFIICSIKDVSATENDKLLWVLLLIFLSYLVFPIYWYIRIWDNPKFSMKEELGEYTN